MASRSDDDLSRTATAHGVKVDATLPASDAQVARPTQIGRYRIERELGQGGMGVVYVAFDPDLERRIALKVLRAATSSEAAQRLQREARAMARLNHPNVVTVHEVGTASGRDYVAMELIDGETLADWLREKRPLRDVLDAFVQAGKGLAAAHEAGIVHRDFKPHNVLRAHGGRIEVTDFGLAREAHAEVAAGDPLARTLPLPAMSTTASTPSTLAGLTVTGSLLGTPAYMAAEQWTGGVVSPATDQFAYCVALWEAVTGKRPFTGPTVEALREQILEGPAALDATKLPRSLRAPLLRGLDPDAKKRWPSMAALLAVISPPPRPLRRLSLIVGGAILASLAINYAWSRRASEPVASVACAAPAATLEVVWSPARRTQLVTAGRTLAVGQLDVDAKTWTKARATACAADPIVRPQMLACLDGVLGRFDTAVTAATAADGPRQIDAGGILVDPAVCTRPQPPRILVPSPALREALSISLRLGSRREIDDAALAASAAHVASDPCATTYLQYARARSLTDLAARREALAAADVAAESCPDDRTRAEAALEVLSAQSRADANQASVKKTARQAELAVQAVAQADLTADLALRKANAALRLSDVPRARELVDAALVGFAARGRVYDQISGGLLAAGLLQVRSTPEDLVAIQRGFASLRALARDKLGPDDDELRTIEQVDAYWSFALGDVAGAHARLAAAARERPIKGGLPLRGKVVDLAGKPVAGATVVSGPGFSGDSVSIALASPEAAGAMRTVTTGADGTFQIEAVPVNGIVVAQLGDRRSYAAFATPDVALTLRPTSRVEGKIELHGLPSMRALVGFLPNGQPRQAPYTTVAPVHADGTFVIEGVPRGKSDMLAVVTGVVAQSASAVAVNVNAPVVRGVTLAAPVTTRRLDVVVRSQIGQPVSNAQIIVLAGAIQATNLKELTAFRTGRSIRLALPIVGEAVPPAIKSIARDGDLYATLDDAPSGTITACAFALPGDLEDTKLQAAIDHNLAKIGITCKPVGEAKVMLIEVPPWPRLD